LNKLQAERIDSIKAGILAGFSFCFTYCMAILVNRLVGVEQLTLFTQLPKPVGIDLLLTIVSAWVSGFLFGVTYRYIIRSDRNPHLKDGAVLAFGLVRGLVFVEVRDNLHGSFYLLSLLTIESLFCFVVARFTIDLAIGRNWVKPYGSGNSD
jgi:hypothetical protein